MNKLKDYLVKYRLELLFSIFLLCIFLIKHSFRYIITDDMKYYLLIWCDFISHHEGISAYKYPFSNYTPLYTYILGLMIHFPVKWEIGIKVISCFFDFVIAFYVYKIIKLKYSQAIWAYIATGTVCILPTVLINGAMWGQCDSIYTAFVIMSLYYILKDQYSIAFIVYGIALSLKIQAIFVAPFFIVLFLTNTRVKIKHVLSIFLVYLVTLIPALIAGRNFYELLTIYINQAEGQNFILTFNSVSFYNFMPNTWASDLGNAGIFISVAITILLVMVYTNKKNAQRENYIEFAFLCALIFPYFLPYMHERYYFMGDILAVVYVFYYRRHFYFLLLPFISFLTYLPYMFKIYTIDFKLLSFGILLLLYLAIKNIVLEKIYSSPSKPNLE